MKYADHRAFQTICRLASRLVPPGFVSLGTAILALAGCADPAYYADGTCRIDHETTLPLAYSGHVPTVQAVINGQTVTLGVDTGAAGTTVTPQTAQRLNLERDHTKPSLVLGIGGLNVVPNVLLDSFKIGSLDRSHMSVAMVGLASESAERPDDRVSQLSGIIGDDILANYDVEIDNQARLLSLYKVTNCTSVTPKWKGAFSTLPMEVQRDQRVVIPVAIDGHPLTALFDSGAPIGNLFLGASGKAGLTQAMMEADPTAVGYGMGNLSFKASVHNFSEFRVGNETFSNPAIAVVNFPTNDSDMLIGEDYMRPRRFWLSYATSTLFVQNTRQRQAGGDKF